MASSVAAGLLKQLSAVSQTINTASDQLNEQIKTIEEAIGSYNLGVSAWVDVRNVKKTDYTNMSPVEYTRQESLGYEQENGKWCLKVSAWIEEIETPAGTWRLLDAPREMRMAAVEAIPKLLEKLTEEAMKIAGRVEAQAARAKVIAGSIPKARRGQ